MKWCNIKEVPDCSRERTPACCTRLCRNPLLILSLLFPQLMTDRLTRCWRSSEQYFLFPWSPGDGQATSPSALAAALGPKRRQVHWGAASSSPWRWDERPAPTQARTFLVSDSASLRSPHCLTAISCKLWSPPTPAPNPFTPSLFVVFFKAWARAKADNSPPLFVLAVLLFWGLLGTLVRCEIRPSSPGRTCEGMYRRGTAHSAQTLLWFFYPRVWKLHSQKHSPFRS